MGRYGEAIQPLTKAYTLRPLNQKLAVNYAMALYWNGDYKRALLPALLYLSSNSTLNYSNLPSKQLVSKIISLVPTKDLGSQIDEVMKSPYIGRNPACRFALADVLDRRGLHDLAMQQYREGLTLAPKYGRAWYRLGLDEEIYSDKYDDAIECYKNASVFAPEDKEVAAHQMRLQDRLAVRNTDVAWALKDKLKLQALFKD
jgi:tetratricopeptide (TPR) repeat protein